MMVVLQSFCDMSYPLSPAGDRPVIWGVSQEVKVLWHSSLEVTSTPHTAQLLHSCGTPLCVWSGRMSPFCVVLWGIYKLVKYWLKMPHHGIAQCLLRGLGMCWKEDMWVSLDDEIIVLCSVNVSISVRSSVILLVLNWIEFRSLWGPRTQPNHGCCVESSSVVRPTCCHLPDWLITSCIIWSSWLLPAPIWSSWLLPAPNWPNWLLPAPI